MVATTGKYKNWAYAAGPISSHEIHSNLERKGYKEKANLTARRLRFLGNIKAFAIIQRPRSLAGNPRQSPMNKSAMPTLKQKVESHDSNILSPVLIINP